MKKTRLTHLRSTTRLSPAWQVPQNGSDFTKRINLNVLKHSLLRNKLKNVALVFLLSIDPSDQMLVIECRWHSPGSQVFLVQRFLPPGPQVQVLQRSVKTAPSWHWAAVERKGRAVRSGTSVSISFFLSIN